jgi:hypothetical protein
VDVEAEPDDPQSDAAAAEPEDSEPDGRQRRPGTTALFAVARAAVVLVAGAVVYQFVIPSTHYVPTRLSRLVVADTGLTQFAGKKPQSRVQDASQTGLAAVNAALKKSPHQTGLYSSEWSASQTSAAVVAAFLLPDTNDAKALQSQFQKQQMAADSFASAGLTRKASGTIASVPGGVMAFYAPSAKGSASPGLGVTLTRVGRVVGLAEVAGGATAQSDAQSLGTTEYTHLTKVVPGFSVSKVDRPVGATSIWAAGTVVLALIAALGPIAWGRWTGARRRRREEEQSHQVVVGDQVIYKYRR